MFVGIEQCEARRLFAVLTINGTSGDDTMSFSLNGNYVDANINGNVTSYSGVSGFLITGAGGNDSITIDGVLTVAATVGGGSGDDFIRTGSGNDQITGGDGNDTILGMDGYDTVNGNNGNDNIFGNNQGDYLFGGDGADSVVGGAGDGVADHLYGNTSSIPAAANDTLVGEGNDVLY